MKEVISAIPVMLFALLAFNKSYVGDPKNPCRRNDNTICIITYV